MQSKLIESFCSIEEPDAVSAKIASLRYQLLDRTLNDKLIIIFNSIKYAVKEGKENIIFTIPISVANDLVNKIVSKLEDKKYKVNLTTDNISFSLKISWDHIDLDEE